MKNEKKIIIHVLAHAREYILSNFAGRVRPAEIDGQHGYVEIVQGKYCSPVLTAQIIGFVHQRQIFESRVQWGIWLYKLG